METNKGNFEKRQNLRYAPAINAHLLQVNSAFIAVASLDFGVFGSPLIKKIKTNGYCD